MTLPMGTRKLGPGQRTEVWLADVASANTELVFSTTEVLLEAPNWAPDGRTLLLNGNGLLWQLDLDAPHALRQLPVPGLPPINNDHVLDSARGLIYLSANDGHLYVAPLAGGTATRITHDERYWHFLHGVSPDGLTLAYVELPAGDFSAPGRLALLPATGGTPSYPDAGDRHLDGPEYSPDGAYVYLNTEQFTGRAGHAQLARLPIAGGPLERLVEADTVDWFPHLSPDGRFACYLSFPRGTLGHPADLPVVIRVVQTADWGAPVAEVELFGGQGTLNVNSWSPDSGRFAYVAYPLDSGTAPA